MSLDLDLDLDLHSLLRCVMSNLDNLSKRVCLSSAMSLSTLLPSSPATATRSFLMTEKTARPSSKMRRPPLEPIATVGPCHLDISVAHDPSPTGPSSTSLNTPLSPPTSSPSESSHNPSQRYASSPSRRRPASRRQSSISYLPADSPRLWTPRTPQLGSDALDRVAPLPGANNGKKVGHVRTCSMPQRAAPQPVVLTLAERHADLLQFIAQKESKCLDLRSQLATHEGELLELKRKWERLVRREFGRNMPSPSFAVSPAPSAASAAALANAGSSVVLNGLVGGVRALAAVTTSPPLTSSAPGTRAPSSAFAKRVTRQAPSNSISSTTTSASSSAPSTGTSPRLSQSSVSSVAEEKADPVKAEYPPGDVVGSPDSSATPAPLLSPKPASVTQQQEQQRSPTTSSVQPPPPSGKLLRRRSRESRAPLTDALRPLTGERLRSRSSWQRASISVSSPSSMSISAGINPLGGVRLGRANLGETAQGWVDSVGSKLAELQTGQTFSKSQKRASVLFSDVSQSIFSALVPASSANPTPASAPPAQSLIDEDDDAGSTALGHAIMPDVVALSARPAPSGTPPPTPETKEEEDEDWNW
ncbi:hypothetical protein BC826DRAFT_1105288 [Russula brevipes]|nr:hypothetical protein BC826DRAFT_1105288 [Russula brevipes]